MDAETWMDANKALELGFIDGILERENTTPVQLTIETEGNEDTSVAPENSMLFSRKAVECALMNKMRHKMIAEAAKIQPKETTPTGRKISDLYDRLNLLNN